MQSICMTKDRGTAGTVMLACPGTRSGVIPALLSCSICSVDVPGQLPHLKKYQLQCQTVWVIFENAPFAEGFGFGQRNMHKVNLYHSCPRQEHTDPRPYWGVPLHCFLILHPILTTQNQNGCVCLDAFAISFRTAWKDFIPKELAQIRITSINRHRIQCLLLPVL